MEEIKMEEIRLERDGLKDLVFTGKEISSATTATTYENDRYSRLALYETKAGAFVLQDCYITHWQGEQSRRHAYTIEIPDLIEKATDPDDDDRVDTFFKELIDGIPDSDERFKEVKEAVIYRIE